MIQFDLPYHCPQHFEMTWKCTTFEEGNILNSSEDCSYYTHCVSSDMMLDAGVAKQFKTKFGEIEILKSQEKKVSEVACLPINRGEFVFNHITKYFYNDKPTVRDIELSYGN
jgi:hypothetical protein